MPEIRDRSEAPRGARAPASHPTRRQFLATSGASAAGLGLAASFAREAYARPTLNLGPRSDLNFLMQRATRGFNKNEMALLTTYGITPQVYLDYLLDIAPADPDTAARNWITPLVTWLDSIPCQYWGTQGMPPGTGTGQIGACSQTFLGAEQVPLAIGYTQIAAFGRSVHTVSRLEDRAVEFLANHLNVWASKDGLGAMFPQHDREVTRLNALRTFPELLKASAHSAAMLAYLDNHLNGATTDPGTGLPIVNENYARELLELHTIAPEDPLTPGVPNYTEADVKEAAKVLSGWRFRIPGFFPADLTSAFGEFFFDASFHVPGPKVVLGHTFHDPGNPQNEGLELLLMLSAPTFRGQPNPVAQLTARFLGWKLTRAFLLDQPNAAVVGALATVYGNTGGSIKELLRELLGPFNVSTYNTTANRKFKTPYELVCSLFRATEADLTNTQTAPHDELGVLGQKPYDWAPPDGYPIDEETWGKNLFPRWVFCQRFFARPNGAAAIPGIELTDGKLALMLGNHAALAQVPIAGLGAAVEAMLTGPGAMAALDVQIVQAFADYVSQNHPGFPHDELVREACALGASTPSFQYF